MLRSSNLAAAKCVHSLLFCNVPLWTKCSYCLFLWICSKKTYCYCALFRANINMYLFFLVEGVPGQFCLALIQVVVIAKKGLGVWLGCSERMQSITCIYILGVLHTSNSTFVKHSCASASLFLLHNDLLWVACLIIYCIFLLVWLQGSTVSSYRYHAQISPQRYLTLSYNWVQLVMANFVQHPSFVFWTMHCFQWAACWTPETVPLELGFFLSKEDPLGFLTASWQRYFKKIFQTRQLVRSFWKGVLTVLNFYVVVVNTNCCKLWGMCFPIAGFFV